MPYLILQDWYTKIQDANLQQVISEVDGYRIRAQAEALTEMRSYLAQKFDIDDEFRETVVFSFTSAFKAKQLVYLDADAYVDATTYNTNDLTLSNGKVYYANQDAVTGAFDAAKWNLLGDQYSFFYIPVPYPEFKLEDQYAAGDFVFWKDKIYTAQFASSPPSHSTQLQYGRVSSLPSANEFPDAANQTQWGTGTAYSLTGLMPTQTSADFDAWLIGTSYTAGDKKTHNSIIYMALSNSTGKEPGTDTTHWAPISYVAGDNRNPMLVGMNITIAIHKVSPRIASYVIPDIWVKNYDDAVSWLKKCAKGDVTLDMPLRQPAKKRIRWGSSIKNINNY